MARIGYCYFSGFNFHHKTTIMAKGKIISKNKVTRPKGHLVYVDGEGNVRAVPMKRGGTKGRRTCTVKKKKAAPKRKAAKQRTIRKTTTKKKAAKKK